MLHDSRYESFQIGDRIEVSPESWGYARQISERINEQGGCGLVIDYGQNRILGDSLRVF